MPMLATALNLRGMTVGAALGAGLLGTAIYDKIGGGKSIKLEILSS